MFWIIKAFRLPTLIASFIPLGLIYYYYIQRSIDQSQIKMFFSALGIAVGIQVCTNAFNDIFDFKSGVDNQRKDKVLNKKRAELLLVICIFILVYVFVLGLNFIDLHWVYLPMGLMSIGLSIFYTASKYSLAYNGLGELFSFIFFGLVLVLGSIYGINKSLITRDYLLAFHCGFHSMMMMAANNLRDHENDINFSKNTLAVKFGPEKFKSILMIFILINFILSFFFFKFFPVVLLYGIFTFLYVMFLKKSKTREQYKDFFKITGVYYFWFSFLGIFAA